MVNHVFPEYCAASANKIRVGVAYFGHHFGIDRNNRPVVPISALYIEQAIIEKLKMIGSNLQRKSFSEFQPQFEALLRLLIVEFLEIKIPHEFRIFVQNLFALPFAKVLEFL